MGICMPVTSASMLHFLNQKNNVQTAAAATPSSVRYTTRRRFLLHLDLAMNQ